MTVFQAHLDILGIVIYSSEFVLWCGVFAAGGYYNLRPWMKGKLRAKRERVQRSSLENEGNGGAVTNDIQLHDLPSSTSVFRTPSSIIRRSIEAD